MPRSTEHFDTFLRRVRWRLTITRALERAGFGVAVASTFACVFAGIALVQGRDAMPLVLPALATGAVIGLICGLAPRVTVFDAAVEADAQLRLSDLLATACAARRDAGDDWQLAIIALANERCRTLSPSDVVVHRFGGRAWGGIGLAAALGLTLGLLSTVPRETRARAANVASDAVTSAASEDQTMGTPPSADSPRPRAQASAEPKSREDVPGESSARSDSTATPQTDSPLGRTGADPGDGSRASQTASSDGLVPRPEPSPRNADGTESAGGGAGSSLGPAGGPTGSVAGATAGGTAGQAQSSAQRTPPWESASWDAARDAAGSAVRDGRVPDAYRDVVGEYFRPEDSR